MSKRAALIQLTSDNADEESGNGEDAGTFELASQEEISNRVIRKAKRGWSEQDSSGSSGSSSGTGVFSKLGESLQNRGATVQFSSSQSGKSAPGMIKPGQVKLDSITGLYASSQFLSSKAKPARLTSECNPSSHMGFKDASSHSQYLQELASLNSSVSKWINKHVEINSYVDLTPIFRDYETHLRQIDIKHKTRIDCCNMTSGDSSEDTSSQNSQSLGSNSDLSSKSSDSTPGPGCAGDIPRNEGPGRYSGDTTPPSIMVVPAPTPTGSKDNIVPQKSKASTASQDSKANTASQDSKANTASQDSMVNIVPQNSKANTASQDSMVNIVPQNSKANTASQDSMVNIVPQNSKANTASQDSKANTASQDSMVNTAPPDSMGNTAPPDSMGNTGPPDSMGNTAPPDLGRRGGLAPQSTVTGPNSTMRMSQSAPLPLPSTSESASKPADDNSLLTIRAKLFYKKGAEFAELGVGTVKVQSSSKGVVHMLMRNDTALGNILLNVKVTKEMPLSTNKKSVLMVCPTPNPPLSAWEGPVTYLLRVKTDEMAGQILSVIQNNI